MLPVLFCIILFIACLYFINQPKFMSESLKSERYLLSNTNFHKRLLQVLFCIIVFIACLYFLNRPKFFVHF